MENRMLKSRSDILLDIVIYTALGALTLFFLYPIIYILANSISSADAVLRREVFLWPVGFSSRSYEMIFEHPYVLSSYANSVVYTLSGTAWSLMLTVLGAYPLSRKYLAGRDFFMLGIAFTMLFSGGLIPTFLLVRDLGLTNTLWAMVFPCAVTPFNLIILRTSMQQIPDSIEESAKIDGANDFTVLFRIILPMSIASIATVALFYLVAKWNDWFNALIYLSNKDMYPLQLILRDMLINTEDKTLNRELLRNAKHSVTPLGFKSALMVVAAAPLLIIYPFIQRYFVKGIMIGAVKG